MNQEEINFKFVYEAIERIHEALCPDATLTNWQGRVMQAEDAAGKLRAEVGRLEFEGRALLAWYASLSEPGNVPEGLQPILRAFRAALAAQATAINLNPPTDAKQYGAMFGGPAIDATPKVAYDPHRIMNSGQEPAEPAGGRK